MNSPFNAISQSEAELRELSGRLCERLESLKRRNDPRLKLALLSISDALLSLLEAEIDLAKARKAEQFSRAKRRKGKGDKNLPKQFMEAH